PPFIAGVMDELHEQLEQKALQGPNGGACIGIAWMNPFVVLCVRTFGDPANWVREFDELTTLKIKVAQRTGLSTRTFLEAHGMKPYPEERDLHPGALIFYERLIVASSGFCIENESTSTLIGGRLESFDIYEEPLCLVATG
ncbi:MAG: hypothetical protein Q8S35_01900, partial [bacterium]|nr:hypothetical protein [bacterium]